MLPYTELLKTYGGKGEVDYKKCDPVQQEEFSVSLKKQVDSHLDLKALEDHIDSSDFVPRAALQSAVDSTVQDYATMSQMDAMLLHMDRLERTNETLKEKLKQPSTPTRHENN